MCGGSPQAKANAPIFATLGAERHVMTALHSTLPSSRFHGAPSAPPSSAPAADRQRRRHCRADQTKGPRACVRPCIRSGSHSSEWRLEPGCRGVEKKFVVVKTMAFFWSERTIYPVSIQLPWTRFRQVTVPDHVGLLGQRNAQDFTLPGLRLTGHLS